MKTATKLNCSNTSSNSPNKRIRQSVKANSPFWRAGQARACQDGELDQATRSTRHFVLLAILASRITEAILLAILESRITQAILLAILASRTSPTRHFGKKDRTSNRASHFGPVLLAILESRITQSILIAILASWTSPTRHFGELDQSYSPKWRVGSSTPSNSPARRIGPNLMPSVEPRRVNPLFRLDRSYHRSLIIRTAKICIPD
ncbi:hypothetical protein F2Q70_00030182 [Brassica cretica]|uniref:Uncharacterized protein n=1 Tax=Brassica cretica TaxID=69181 RepID=A0A8S9H605_BRACR|nr:hypothetical protein F2Q70_00030182 [Brassica cretica]KAF2551428.1 hypothetical protein F2Q68_00034646 [Brassica cretica]